MGEAKGDVLLVDEAYGLDQDCIHTVIEMAPAKVGADMVLVIVGYQDEIEDLLQRKSNPGRLSSRFPNIWHFESYNQEQLLKISRIVATERRLLFLSLCKRKQRNTWHCSLSCGPLLAMLGLSTLFCLHT